MTYATCLFCGQVILYLRSGVWPSLPASHLFIRSNTEKVILTEDQLALLRFMPRTTSYQEWLLHPDDWFGLHKTIIWFLNGISVPGLVLLLAVLLSFWAEQAPAKRATD